MVGKWFDERGGTVHGVVRGPKLGLYFLVASPLVVDFLSGWLRTVGVDTPVTPSDLWRGVLLAAGVIAVTLPAARRIASLRNRAVILGVAAAGIMFGHFFGGQALRFYDVEYIAGVIYGPMVAVLYWMCFRSVPMGDRPQLAVRSVAITGSVIGLLLIVSKISGYGHLTYDSEYGSQLGAWAGFFSAVNDTSLVMVICLIGAVTSILNRLSWFGVLLTGLNAAGLYLLGTRTAVLGGVVALVGVPLLSSVLGSSGARRKGSAIAGTILVVVFALGYTYKNWQRVAQVPWAVVSYETVISGQVPRAPFIEAGIEVAREHPAQFTIAGFTPHGWREKLAGRIYRTERKSAEVDWLDQAGSLGVMFCIGLYWFYVYYLLRSIRWLRGSYRIFCALSLGIFLVHSLLAGHTMASTVVGGIIAVPIVITERLTKLRTVIKT